MLDEGWTPEEIVKLHYPFLSLELVEGLVGRRKAVKALMEKWEEGWREKVKAIV